MYHIPVLLSESVEGLNINAKGLYADVTFGGGGHSREIVKQLKKGHLYAFDQDADAEQNSKAFETEFPKTFTFTRHNFRFISNFLRYYGVDKLDGIIADLGVSWHQFDSAERGFSFRFDSDLDMRMNKESKLDAKKIINTYSEQRLASLFFEYGELNNSRQLAKGIVESRYTKEIQTVQDFLAVVQTVLKSSAKGKKTDDLEHQLFARIFQALRIEVNGELQYLKSFLEQTVNLLKPQGRLVVISYHSLEDRLVKNFIRNGKFEGEAEKDVYGNTNSPFEAVNRKVIIPSDEEIKLNNRARSAKLRIAQRI